MLKQVNNFRYFCKIRKEMSKDVARTFGQSFLKGVHFRLEKDKEEGDIFYIYIILINHYITKFNCCYYYTTLNTF